MLKIITAIAIVLGAPAVLKKKNNPLKDFTGSTLSELKFKEINFTNTEEEINLAGMLFLPQENQEDFPVGVIIHGSGNSFRESRWYLELVKQLQSNGVGVLLPDKRGCEKSEGDWRGASIEKLATDTHAAIKYAKSRFPNQKVGIVGVSQGGWIAPVVASQDDSLSFIVNISGSFTDGSTQLRFEETNNIAQYTYKPIARLISGPTTKRLSNMKVIKPFVDFDPIPYWKSIDASKAFIAFGENDTNCPVQKSLSLIAKNRLDNFSVNVYPDGKHAILNADKDAISDRFIDDLIQFIHN